MKLDKFQMEGRIAVITGGAGLLGRQHAEALLECGATTYLADVDEARTMNEVRRLELEYPSRVFPLAVDITSLSSVENALRKVLDAHRSVSILINNAAIDAKVSGDGLGPGRFENFALQQWNKELEVGLTGAFLCSQIFGRWMAQNGGGAILNIASDLSVIAPDQRLYRKDGLTENEQPAKPITYSVIKTGLIGLTRYLAGYWAPQNVRVNAISPGGVFNGQPEEFVQRLTNLIPMGRMARPDEYRSAVQFLCSDASSYLTGQNIVIDGGRSIL